MDKTKITIEIDEERHVDCDIQMSEQDTASPFEVVCALVKLGRHIMDEYHVGDNKTVVEYHKALIEKDIGEQTEQ